MGLASGQSVPMTPRALWTPEHLVLHKKFFDENKQDFQQEVLDAFADHISAEE
jgi:hypothetical protein